MLFNKAESSFASDETSCSRIFVCVRRNFLQPNLRLRPTKLPAAEFSFASDETSCSRIFVCVRRNFLQLDDPGHFFHGIVRLCSLDDNRKKLAALSSVTQWSTGPACRLVTQGLLVRILRISQSKRPSVMKAT